MVDLPEREQLSKERQPVPEPPDDETAAFINHIARRLPPGEPVLDAGCGRGRNAFYLSQAGFSVYGIDRSSIAAEIARARLANWCLEGCIQVSDLLHLPYEDETFAAAVCVHVLPYHRKESLCACVRELRRVLRPGGYLYFDLLDVKDAAYGGGRLIEPDTFLNLHGLPIHFSTREEIDELAEDFRVDRVVRMEMNSLLGARVVWGVWAVKPAS